VRAKSRSRMLEVWTTKIGRELWDHDAGQGGEDGGVGRELMFPVADLRCMNETV
jgi:hypothetical protein